MIPPEVLDRIARIVALGLRRAQTPAPAVVEAKRKHTAPVT